MIKYRASVIAKKIDIFEAVRETEKFVVFNSSWRDCEYKEAKIGEFVAYFDSFGQAKEWLVKHYEQQTQSAEFMLKSYKDGLEIVLGLEPPSDD